MSETETKKDEKKVKKLYTTVKTRKFMTNRLLKRKQFIVDVLHPGRQSLSNADLTKKLVKMYKVQDPSCVFLFGFKSQFGGGKSTGFCLIYDNVTAAKKIEPKFRLVRNKLATKVEKSRKQMKERKNRAKKVFSKEKIKTKSKTGKEAKEDKKKK